jgi:phosphoglycolate phosphatase
MHQKKPLDERLFFIHRMNSAHVTVWGNAERVNPRAVVFDLDGTLVDSAGEIAEALAIAFAEVGARPLPLATVETLIGRGVRSTVERGLELAGAKGVDLEDAIHRFEAHYARTVGQSAAVYPGVVEGLRMMRDRGLKLGVVTNKPRSFTVMLLERVGIAQFMDAIVAGDDGFAKKPAGDMVTAACEKLGAAPNQTLVIGDSANDTLAARNAGSPVWCVPYGYNEGRDPRTLDCDRLVASIDEAARILAGTV